MATSCPAPFTPVAGRFTKLDTCGRPLNTTVANSRYQFASGAVTKVELALNTEDGKEIVVPDWTGALCLNKKQCDRLKNIEVKITLCGYIMPLLEMALGIATFTASSNVIGGMLPDSSQATNCQNFVMFESWRLDGKANACDGAVSYAYVKELFPKISNWSVDSLSEISAEGTGELVIKGTSERNSQWSPSFPGALFPTYDDATDTWTGSVGATPLPVGVVADDWTTADKTAIRAGGPYGWKSVNTTPTLFDPCGYVAAAVEA